MVKQHHDFCIRCGHQVPPSPLLTRTGHVWKASVWRSAVHSTVNRSFVTHCSCKFGQLPALFETNLSSLYTAIIKTHKVTGKMKRSDTVWQELSQSMSLLGGLGSSTQPCHILKEKIQPAPGVWDPCTVPSWLPEFDVHCVIFISSHRDDATDSRISEFERDAA